MEEAEEEEDEMVEEPQPVAIVTPGKRGRGRPPRNQQTEVMMVKVCFHLEINLYSVQLCMLRFIASMKFCLFVYSKKMMMTTKMFLLLQGEAVAVLVNKWRKWMRRKRKKWRKRKSQFLQGLHIPASDKVCYKLLNVLEMKIQILFNHFVFVYFLKYLMSQCLLLPLLFVTDPAREKAVQLM